MPAKHPFLFPQNPYIRSMSKLERFAEWCGKPWFAVTYVFATCFRAILAAWAKAKAENMPEPETTNEKSK